MKKLGLLFIGLAALASCQSKTGETVYLKPVTKAEIQQIKTNLLLGQNKILPTDAIEAAEARECETFRSSLPAGYFQDFAFVPEDWSKPEGRKIKVFYYGRLQAGKDPVVFYNGGPTGDSHSSYQVLSGDAQYNHFSFIFIDQRGTGCSDAYPIEEKSFATIQRLAKYGSRSIVMDSEAIRAKLLGEKKWKIFGQSYGGHIVQRYTTIGLQNVISAHSHGFSIMENSTEWLALRLKSQKRVVEDYFAKYPDDRAKIPLMQASLEDNFCVTDGTMKACGKGLVDGLTMLLGFSTSWPFLHSTINQIITKEGFFNQDAFLRYARNYVLGIYAETYAAAGALGVVDMTNGKAMLNPCPDAEKILESWGETPQTWIFNECRLLGNLKSSTWDPFLNQLIDTGTAVDELSLVNFKNGLLKSPQTPFYLYSGQLDIFVPVETFEQEIKFVEGLVHYTQFPNSGHEGFHTEALVWQNLKK